MYCLNVACLHSICSLQFSITVASSNKDIFGALGGNATWRGREVMIWQIFFVVEQHKTQEIDFICEEWSLP
jgi:hypothetical protein